MAIEIKCNCGLEYRLDDNRAGENFKCRLCGAEIYLQAGVGRASPNSKLSANARRKASQANSTGEIESAEDAAIEAVSGRKLFKAQPVQEASEVASVFSDYDTPELNGPAKEDQPAHKAPPLGWWVVRSVMWMVAITFICAPWLKMSLYNPEKGHRETEHITGWQMAASVVDELRYTGTIHPAAAAPILENYTDPNSEFQDITIVALGGKMMAVGAAVFLAAVIAVPIAAVLVLLTGPRVMALPFAVCFISLAVFTGGWFTAAASEPMTVFLDTLAANNCYMGVSASVYLMLPVLAMLVFRAGIKPDYKLLQAIQWSRQRQKEQQADS